MSESRKMDNTMKDKAREAAGRIQKYLDGRAKVRGLDQGALTLQEMQQHADDMGERLREIRSKYGLDAEPVASSAQAAAWIDEFGNVFPLAAYSPTGKPNYRDAHKRGWKPLYTAPQPAQPAQAQVVPEGWHEIMTNLLHFAESQTCQHDETHRGGAIWEICNQCGAKWADDEGGRPEFKWPDAIAGAQLFLAAPALPQQGGKKSTLQGRQEAIETLAGDQPEQQRKIAERHIYRKSAEWSAYLRARFADKTSNSFDYDGHRWMYRYNSFDDQGDYDVIYRFVATATDVIPNQPEQLSDEVIDKIEAMMWRMFEYGKKDYRGCGKEQVGEARSLLSSRKESKDAALKKQNAELMGAMQDVVDHWTAQFERNGHLAPPWVKRARAAIDSALAAQQEGKDGGA